MHNIKSGQESMIFFTYNREPDSVILCGTLSEVDPAGVFSYIRNIIICTNRDCSLGGQISTFTTFRDDSHPHRHAL